VPLLVHAPQVNQGQVVDSVFSLLHLAPTLLDAMDLPIPGSFRGRSHWRQLPQARSGNEAAVVECVAGCTNPIPRENRLGRRLLGIREKRYKLVLDFASSAEQMFDLRDDPAELHPLGIDKEKPVRKRLLQVARRHLAESTQSLDPEQRLSAQLRDLQLELAHS
jgi:arylsulfatase A-like enzyme